jgi:hypothetical protein
VERNEKIMDVSDVLLFRSLDVLRDGWAKTRQNLGPWLGLGGIGAFMALLQQALSHPGHDGLGNLLGLVLQVLQSVLMMVFIRSALALSSGRPLPLVPVRAELFSDFFGYLLTTILYGLIVAFGLVLLIVPGVGWALKFGFAPFLAVDEGLDPLAALRESARLTRGVEGKLLRFALLVLAVNAIGALAMGVGLFVTIPTTLIATADVLRRLQDRSRAPARAAPERDATAPDAVAG